MKDRSGMSLRGLMPVSVQERGFKEGDKYRQTQQNGGERLHCAFVYRRGQSLHGREYTAKFQPPDQ